MDNKERERLNKLQLIKFSKFNILNGYKHLGSLREVQIEASLDLALVTKLMKEDKETYCGVHNLLHNFIWYICYSDGNTKPLGLWEDNIYGISYYKMMQDIRNKFIESEND